MKIIISVTTTPELIQITTNNSENPAPEDQPIPHAAYKADQCFQGSIEQARRIIVEGFFAQRTLRAVHEVVQTQTGDELTLTMDVDDDVIACHVIGLRMGFIFHRAFPNLLTPAQLERDIPQLKTLEAEMEAEYAFLNPADPSAFESGFKKDFLRRVPANERLDILKKMNDLKPLTFSQLEALKLNLLSHTVFQQEDWPLLALRAFLEGFLDEYQISKLFLYDQCIIESPQNFPRRCFQLFTENGQLDPDAASMLEKGLGAYFSAEEKQKLWKDLRNLPLHDGTFFAVESPIFAETMESLEASIEKNQNIDVAAYFLHMGRFPLFLVQESENQGLQLVIPPALLEGILKSKFGPTVMKPNPVLGFFKKEKLSLPGSRVATIPCRYVSQPTLIHEFSATRLSSYHHDVYHLFLESGNPHRPAWIELAMLRAPLRSEVRGLLFDREFPLYSRPESHEMVGKKLDNVEEKFWYSLADLTFRAIRKGDDNIADICLLLDHIYAQNDRWKKEYGIDLQTLKMMDVPNQGLLYSPFCSLQTYAAKLLLNS